MSILRSGKNSKLSVRGKVPLFPCHAILLQTPCHYLIVELVCILSRGDDFCVDWVSIGSAHWRKVLFLSKFVSFSYFIFAHVLQTQHTSRHFVDPAEIYNICKEVLESEQNS
jgi:hypothetical protein